MTENQPQAQAQPSQNAEPLLQAVAVVDNPPDELITAHAACASFNSPRDVYFALLLQF